MEEFGDVGLMTGDITINPSAGCLVMTTEILRNMLYRGSEVVREVSTVIYDEIHYMRNAERGVVWEETIILLPHSVSFVFLSATIPNASEFACWVAKLHSQPVNVVYTDYRPTPLQHYLFPAGSDGLHLVVDDKGTFREDNFHKALALLKADAPPGADTPAGADGEGGKQPPRKKRRRGAGEVSDVFKLVKMCQERHYQPVIVFSFSKMDCEAHAQAMARLDFSDATERQLIDTIFHNAVSSLSPDDRQLPQVTSILPILRRGIGIHHSGLLPILKEVIEILFQEGLLKCLFSTETFSMGLNMPAKTVVFTSVRKWDGVQFRVVSSGEYIQMSGRAGRRGLDERGIVIAMLDEALDPAVAKAMLKGESDVLNSSFHLGYNMLLNLLRVEDVDPLALMARSFHQFQSTRRTPDITRRLEGKEAERATVQVQLQAEGGDAAQRYVEWAREAEEVQQLLRALWLQPQYVVPFLNPGRVVRVRAQVAGEAEWGWGVLLSHQVRQRAGSKRGKAPSDLPSYVLSVLVKAATPLPVAVKGRTVGYKAAGDAPGGEWVAVEVGMGEVDALSSIRLVLPKDVRDRAGRKSVGANLAQVRQSMGGVVPVLTLGDMKVEGGEVTALQARLKACEERMAAHPLHAPALAAQRAALRALYGRAAALDAEVRALEAERRAVSADVVMRQQLTRMQEVLRLLGCTTASRVMDVKGRVAAEVSTCDELVAAELMLNGVFLGLDAPTLVALCSALVMNERVEEEVKGLRAELKAPFQVLTQTARRVAEVQRGAGLEVDVEDYVARFSPTLMEVVYTWCKGAKFKEVMKLTDVFEGTIIRCMRRLEELLRQLGNAAKGVGSTQLEGKFAQGIDLLKRDIVFAASLYL